MYYLHTMFIGTYQAYNQHYAIILTQDLSISLVSLYHSCQNTPEHIAKQPRSKQRPTHLIPQYYY